VRNPYIGFDPNAASAPAPTDFDHAQVTLAPAARRQYLTYLAMARRPDSALVWPSKFDGRKPYPNIVALAQIKVFNNHSWDLWTQMWTAQLEPIQNYDDWVTRLRSTTSQARQVPALDPQELDDLYAYLHAAAPLAPALLRH
jgi:hypothetical protein